MIAARLAAIALPSLILGACAVSMQNATLAPALPELWVDGSAPAGGDGTVQRPFKALASLPAGPWRVHLRTGLYPGPLRLGPASVVEGEGQAVVFLEGPGTVVELDGATLAGVWVQGGDKGLVTRGDAHARKVGFSSAREIALEVAAGALTGEQLTLEKPGAAAVGVRLLPGTRAALRGVQLEGPWRRGLDAQEASLAVVGLSSRGALEAVHVEGGEANLSQLEASGGRGPGVFSAHARLVLADGTVRGHEYGLQAAGGVLTVDRLRSVGAQRAAIATVRATGTLRDLTLERFGDLGGLQLLESTLQVTRALVREGDSVGVLVRLGEVGLTSVDIRAVRGGSDEGGDGLMVRGGVVRAQQLQVSDVPSMGVFAAAAARVELVDFTCTRCALAALYAERGATVDSKRMTVVGPSQSAVAVPDAATVTLEGVTLSQEPSTALWADCGEGARIVLKGATLAQLPRGPGCVTRVP